MTSAISSGLAGFSCAETTLNTAAGQIATWPTKQLSPTGPSSTPSDVVDLSDSMISLLQAKNNGLANLKTIHVAEEMQQSLIDVLG